MSRFPAVPKTIHGVEVDQTTFKRVICDAIAEMQNGSAKMADLLPTVGPEWDTSEGRKLLAQTLVNLSKRGSLVSDPTQRGVYTVAPRYKRIGNSVRHQQEDSIIDSIRTRGGFARASEIMDDHGLRAHGEDLKEFRAHRTRRQYGTEIDGDQYSTASDVRNTTPYHQFLAILRTSERIRQDYFYLDAKGERTTDGWYNLTQDELNRLVLRGEFAARIIKATHLEFGRTDDGFVHRDAHFTAVGLVYEEARTFSGMSRLDLAMKPRVREALVGLSRIPAVSRGLKQHFNDTTAATVAEMREAGAKSEEIASYREARIASAEGQEFLVGVLERFEKGGEPIAKGLNATGVNVHLNAPLSFYEALAAELGIDPVAASRGFLAMDVRGARVPISKAHPDWDRRLELQEKREEAWLVNVSGRKAPRKGVLYIDGVAQDDDDAD